MTRAAITALSFCLAAASRGEGLRMRYGHQMSGPSMTRSVSLKTALTALYENGGGTLELDPGVYEMCEELDFDPVRGPKGIRAPYQPTLIIRGAGGESQGVTIRCSAGFKGNGTDPCFFRFRGKSDSAQPYAIWLENISIAGGDSAALKGVTGISVEDRRVAIHLKDVHFRQLKTGMRLEEGVGRFVLEYCKFSAISRFGADLSGSGDGSVLRCEFANIGLPSSNEISAALHVKGNTVISENIFGSCRKSVVLIRPDISGEMTIVFNEFDLLLLNGRFLFGY